MNNNESESAMQWRHKALEYQKNYQAAKEELEEFQLHSRELEQELESQLDMLEKKNNELTAVNERLLRERDSLRERLDHVQTDARRQVARMEEQLDEVVFQRDSLRQQIRELEQDNDDLERAKRNVLALIENLEKQLNQSLELNALLESEVTEKDLLQATLQRAKEEARDLRHELNARHQQEQVSVGGQLSHSFHPSDPSVPMDTDAAAFTPPAPAKGMPRSQTVDGSVSLRPAATKAPITPANRISALNIVGDLLRKVGALEAKLSACRKSASRDGKGGNGGPEPKQPHLSGTPLLEKADAVMKEDVSRRSSTSSTVSSSALRKLTKSKKSAEPLPR